MLTDLDVIFFPLTEQSCFVNYGEMKVITDRTFRTTCVSYNTSRINT